MLRSLGILGAAAFWLVLGAFPATAQTAGPLPCGRVTAYVEPTANTAGSITLGTSRFELAAGSAPDREIAVGSDLCIEGDRNAAGAYTSLIVTPMGEGVCGVVTAYHAPSASAAGSITLSSARGTFALEVSPGVTLTREQVTGGQCFRMGVNSQGNPEVSAYIGVWELAPSASPTAGGLPSTTVTATPSTPQEAVGPTLPTALAALAVAAVVVVGILLARVARRTG